LTIRAATPVADGPGWRLRFERRIDRTSVEDLRGAYLEAVVDPATELEPDAVYWNDMLGVRVVGTDGRELGTIGDVYRAGGAEVYVVTGGPAGELDVPATTAVIREFAPREGRIVVDPEALGLDDDPADRRGPTPERLARGIRRRERKAAREAEIERLRTLGDADPAPEADPVPDAEPVPDADPPPDADGGAPPKTP
jgi:hypothetical protein